MPEPTMLAEAPLQQIPDLYYQALNTQKIKTQLPEHQAKEIYIHGAGALPLLYLSIIVKLSCWRRRKLKLCFSKQLIKKMIDNCKSSCAPSLVQKFSWPGYQKRKLYKVNHKFFIVQNLCKPLKFCLHQEFKLLLYHNKKYRFTS